jgi:two-component system OmpR family response regulator
MCERGKQVEMSPTRHILVVEDEKAVRERMAKILQFEGYAVDAAQDVGEAIRQLDLQLPDVILCDIMMPKGDGVDLVSLVRSRADTRLIPIIMVTALTERRWQRRFMDLGADDFLTKPFRAEELVNAVETQCAKLSWHEQALQKASPGRMRKFAGHAFDPVQRVLKLESQEEAGLTTKEAQLLTVLLDHAGEDLSRERIMVAMGRSYDPMDRGIDILIGRLRKLIGDDTRNPSVVRTVRGQGYRLDVEVSLD